MEIFLKLLDLMSKILPILPSLPSWLRYAFSTWVIFGIIIWVPILIYWLVLPPTNQAEGEHLKKTESTNVQQQAIEQSPGSTNIQVGGDLILQAPTSSQPTGGKYSGVLLSPKAGLYPDMEIGNSGTIFRYTGEKGTPIFSVLNGTNLTIESEEGRIKVSTFIHDRTGAVIAELSKNEWKVAPSPRTWDRNYSDHSLEVKDDRGDIVLQVRMLQGRVQLQAVYYDGPESGLAFVEDPRPEKGGVIEIFRPGGHQRTYKIKPIFRYPSEHHLGELIQLTASKGSKKQ